MDAAIRGPIRQPQITGRMNIKNASLTVADFPNGLNQINGAVLFEGSRATIQDVTAETGGGKVTLAGFVSIAGERAGVSHRRYRGPGPSALSRKAPAPWPMPRLTWTGSSPAQRALRETVTILRTGLNRRTDFSSLFRTHR